MLRAFGDRSFSAAAPTLWNALPVNIRNLEALDLFKSTLKTYLFKLAFYLYFYVIIRTDTCTIFIQIYIYICLLFCHALLIIFMLKSAI